MATTPLKRAEVQFAGHHVVSTFQSAVVLGALAVLMGLTIGASYIHMPVVLANVVAMTIATVKALLVMNYFMGLKWSSKLTKLWAAAGFVTFSLMFLILFDYNARGSEVAPGWNDMEGPAMPRVIDPTKSHEQPGLNKSNFQLRQQAW